MLSSCSWDSILFKCIRQDLFYLLDYVTHGSENRDLKRNIGFRDKLATV